MHALPSISFDPVMFIISHGRTRFLRCIFSNKEALARNIFLLRKRDSASTMLFIFVSRRDSHDSPFEHDNFSDVFQLTDGSVCVKRSN